MYVCMHQDFLGRPNQSSFLSSSMNVFVLLFLSFFILLSSLSENFEFLVHNEESLLILCFIAFIFFAYNFLSVGFYGDFQKRVFDLVLAGDNAIIIGMVASQFKESEM